MEQSRTTPTATRRLAAVLAGSAAAVLLLAGRAPTAAADHAEEKVEVSKTADLVDGETVKVTFSGFTPGGRPAKAVIAGQGKLTTIPDKLNLDEYGAAPAVDVAADGTGSFDLVVVADHGTVRDGTTLDCKIQQCWIVVVQEPFLPQPNYNSVPITFAGGSVVAPSTTVAGGETTTVPLDPAVSTTAAAAESTTTAAPADASTTTTEADTAPTSTSGDSSGDDEDGGSGALYAIIAVVVVALGAGGFVIARRKPPV